MKSERWLTPRQFGESLDPPLSTTKIQEYADRGVIPGKFVVRNPGPRGRRKIHRDAIEYLQRIRHAA